MKIYTLTPIGSRLARSTSSPDSPVFRVIHFLDKVGHSTVEQVAEYCGASTGETSSMLGILRRKKIVNEVSGTEV